MEDHFVIKSPINAPGIEGILNEEDQPKPRSRSKSSSAIFGFPDEQSDEVQPMANIWASSHAPGIIIPLIAGQASAAFNQTGHRRASTQPSQQTLMWEALRYLTRSAYF